MNKQYYRLLIQLIENSNYNQRQLAENLNCSLGYINKGIQELRNNQFIDENNNPTNKGKEYINSIAPKKAIILAAGFGMRMVPINLETPKAFLEVKGERLIDRLIKQLHEAGIKDIYVVVGFMKESFEYLIDEYHVELIVNNEYASKNNLYSLYLASKYLDNSYIVPSDLWFLNNPFNKLEPYSWYMMKDLSYEKGQVRITSTNNLVKTKKGECGHKMVGLSYISKDDSDLLKTNLTNMVKDGNDNAFWEEALFNKDKMITLSNTVSDESVIEINTYEQLRELDGESAQLRNDAIEIIKEALHVNSGDIKNIRVLKKGMTNRSFLFSVKDKEYIMRIPGEGTDKLINRKEEAEVYSLINNRNICDNIIYINPNNGYKITEFFNNARNSDPDNYEEVKKCMAFLRKFHELKLKTNHTFDIYKMIEFYEKLWNGNKSVFKDYELTKKKMYELKSYIDEHKKEYSLTHIDAVCDNFLFIDTNGKEEVRLIDWEYAGNQDTDVDLAMNCIYALYNREQVDKLIDAYYVEGCKKETRIKIYCYIAICGLLWSNWCEYKRSLGVEFGEYALRQYRYAKDYYEIVKQETK